MFMRPSRRVVIVGVVAVLLFGSVGWYALSGSTSSGGPSLVATVKQGDFHVTVSTTGELQAKEATRVQGPTMAQMVNVYQSRISSIVPEGTVVKKGDLIAELDRTQAANKLSDVTLTLQKATAEYTSAQLDSALTLAQAREEIRTADYALEEKKLAKEQSQYEAPTIQRQAQIDYERAQRAAAQSRNSYETKLKQAVAKMSQVGAERDRQANQLQLIQTVIQGFTVRAPGDGMVIYVREWNGQKKGVNSQWTAWDPTVATLPDLRQMESNTYVNEVDVRKVAVGQKVRITLDADPSKKLTGTVSAVANVGEQRPNQDSKVFEVKIRVTESDTTLRPGMTTANVIETSAIPGVLYLPIEAVNADSAGSYVYLKRGRGVVRQRVVTGAMNDNEIIVVRGVKKGDEVLLTPPADAAGLPEVKLPGVTGKSTPHKPATPVQKATTAAPAASPAAQKPASQPASAGRR